jgi:hypothetical protein
MVAAVTLLMLLGWLGSSAVLWWDTKAIAEAQLHRLRLQSEVAELQANRDGWVNAGVLGKIAHRDLGHRP